MLWATAQFRDNQTVEIYAESLSNIIPLYTKPNAKYAQSTEGAAHKHTHTHANTSEAQKSNANAINVNGVTPCHGFYCFAGAAAHRAEKI